MRRNFVLFFSCFFLSLLSFSQVVEIDINFGVDGKRVPSFGATYPESVGRFVLINNNFRIIAGGSATSVESRDNAVCRINSLGALDSGFSGDGVYAFSNFPPSQTLIINEDLYHCTQLADNNFICMQRVNFTALGSFQFVKTNQNFGLVNAFGDSDGDGDTGLTSSPYSDYVVDDSENIYHAFTKPVQGTTVIRKFNADGTLDDVFNAQPELEFEGRFSDMELFNSDLYVLVMYTDQATGATSNYSLLKMDLSGNIDYSFTSLEMPQAPEDESNGHLVATSEGKWVVASGANGVVHVRQLLTDGSPDISFSDDGILEFQVIPTAELIQVTSLNSFGNGGILITGNYTINGIDQSFIAALQADGNPDETFHSNGIYFPDWGGSHTINDLTLDNLGRLVVTGGILVNEVERLYVARFLSATVNVSEVESSGFQIFPNPVAEHASISVKVGSGPNLLSIYNTDGQLVHSEQITEGGEQINLSYLSPGLYIAQLNNDRGSFVLKFIRE
jgi:hypothetical protein